MNVEKNLEIFEREIKSLKTMFEQSAVSLDIKTFQSTITTHAVQFTYSNSQPYYDPWQWSRLTEGYLAEGGTPFQGPYYANEQIQVTFRSDNGDNAIASIEISDQTPGGANVGFIRRQPFDGGARWRLDFYPKCKLISPIGEYSWNPTTIKVVVHSMMPGTLEVIQL